MRTPQLFVVAGPNGAGKSTFEKKYLAGRLPFINPDNIAKEMREAGADPAGINVAAGRAAVDLRRDMLKNRNSFSVETTLTGTSPIRLLREAREAGYKVNLVFVGLKNEALSRFRVQTRVKLGGHDIPTEDLERRFSRSMQNLQLAVPLVDRLWILDNSDQRYRLILSRDDDQLKRVSSRIPTWVPQSVTDAVT